MAQPCEEERFHQNIIDLINLVSDLVTISFNKGYHIVKPELVQFAGGILAQFDKVKIINNFITRSNKHWLNILNKNEEFFVNHSHEIFSELPVSNIDAFKKLFTLVDEKGKPVIDKEDREAIWSFF